MKILLIDNFDSFTFNLFQQIYRTCQMTNIAVEDFVVLRNDDPGLLELSMSDYDCVVISPGPGSPEDTGLCKRLIKDLIGVVPIFGICLGHQLLANYLGAKVIHAQEPVHGKKSKVVHNSAGLFKDIPSPFDAARYHSLIVSDDSLPEEIIVTARALGSSEIMAFENFKLKIFGVQFHPESFLTDFGDQIFKNFFQVFNSSKIKQEDVNES